MQQALRVQSARPAGPTKANDFRKDIIIPTIYSLDNYQFIKNGSTQQQPQRKVLTLKKNKVQAVVETIVSKKIVQPSKKVAMYPHRLSRPVSELKMKPHVSYSPVVPNNMNMDFDERFNQRILFEQEKSTNKKQKLASFLQKVKQIQNVNLAELTNQQLNFYITQISPKKNKKPKSTKKLFFTASKIFSKQYKGYVEEQQEIESKRLNRNKKQVSTVKVMTVKRPQTAGSKNYRKTSNINQNYYKSHQILFRSDSLMNTRLSRFEESGSLSMRNLNHKNSHQKSKQLCKNLIQTIQSSCLQNKLNKNSMMVTLNKLGMVWKTEKQLLEAQSNKLVLDLSRDNLNLLMSHRKKQSAINQIDAYLTDDKIQ